MTPLSCADHSSARPTEGYGVQATIDDQKPPALRRPLLWTVGGFLLCFAALVAGSIVQEALGLPWTMGWMQQVFAAVAALLLAAAAGQPRALLGLVAPRRGWIVATLAVSAAGVLVGEVSDLLTGSAPEPHGLEWFAYQATMPGVGEELFLRGLVLGALLVAARRGRAKRGRDWIAVVAAAVPFGLLHLFEHEGLDLLWRFTYTAFAGVLLGWLRVATGSLLPAVIAHNLINVGGGAADWLQVAAGV